MANAGTSALPANGAAIASVGVVFPARLEIYPHLARLQIGHRVLTRVVAEDEDARDHALQLAITSLRRGARVEVILHTGPLFITRWQPDAHRRQPPAEILPLEPHLLAWMRHGSWLLVTRQSYLTPIFLRMRAAGITLAGLRPAALGVLDRLPAEVERGVWQVSSEGGGGLLIVDPELVRWECLPETPAAWPERVALAQAELLPEAPESVPVHAVVPKVLPRRGRDWRDAPSRAADRRAFWALPCAVGTMAGVGVIIANLTVYNLMAARQEVWAAMDQKKAEIEALEAALQPQFAREAHAAVIEDTLRPRAERQRDLVTLLEQVDTALAAVPDAQIVRWQSRPDGRVEVEGVLWSRTAYDARADLVLPNRFQVLLDHLNTHLIVREVALDASAPARLTFRCNLEVRP